MRLHNQIKPKQTHYDALEVDEFWTYVGEKKNKIWLIYAYHRETGVIVSWVLGKCNLKTERALRTKLKETEITHDTIYTDNWQSFVTAFKLDNNIIDYLRTSKYQILLELKEIIAGCDIE